MPTKQSNHHFSYSIEVENSLENVWNFLTDVTKWSQWDTELKSAQLDNEFKVGGTGKLIPKTGPKLSFILSEIEPHKSYTFKTKMPVGHLEIKRILEENEGKVVFTDDIQFTGFLKRLFGVMLGGGFKKVLPEVMNNFKVQAEKIK